LALLAVCVEIFDNETIDSANNLIGRFGSLFARKGPRALGGTFIVGGGLGGEE
jgi:hypothetical protein